MCSMEVKMWRNNIFIVSLVRELISTLVFVLLIVLKNDVQDTIMFIIGCLKFLIIFINCGLVIQKQEQPKHNLLCAWIICGFINTFLVSEMIILMLVNTAHSLQANFTISFALWLNFLFMAYLIIDSVAYLLFILFVVLALNHGIQEIYTSIKEPGLYTLSNYLSRHRDGGSKNFVEDGYELQDLKHIRTGTPDLINTLHSI